MRWKLKYITKTTKKKVAVLGAVLDQAHIVAVAVPKGTCLH